jgi:hypothetical protein
MNRVLTSYSGGEDVIVLHRTNRKLIRRVLPIGRVPYRLRSAYEVERLVTVTDQTIGATCC